MLLIFLIFLTSLLLGCSTKNKVRKGFLGVRLRVSPKRYSCALVMWACLYLDVLYLKEIILSSLKTSIFSGLGFTHPSADVPDRTTYTLWLLLIQKCLEISKQIY